MFTTRRKPVRRLNPMVKGLEGRQLLSTFTPDGIQGQHIGVPAFVEAPVADSFSTRHGVGNVTQDIKSWAPVTDAQGGHGAANIIAIL